MRLAILFTLAAISGAAISSTLAQDTAYKPGPQNIHFPADYQTSFVRYAVIDRPDRKQVLHIYVSPQAFADVKKGAAMPEGTFALIEQHAAKLGADGEPLRDLDGRFIPEAKILGYLAQEKRKGWGVAYPDNLRNGDWEYAAFNADGNQRQIDTAPCLTCHLQNRKAEDFTFTLWDYAQKRR